MKLNIRNKILIGFASLLLLSSLIQAFSFTITNNFISSQINNAQLLETRKGASELQHFFDDLNTIALSLAVTFKEDPVSATNAATSKSLVPATNYVIKNNREDIRRITYLTPVGRELIKFDSNGLAPADDLSYELFTDSFKSAAAGKTSISKVYYLDKELGPHIDVFSPVFSSNDVIAVIKIQISLEELRKKLEDIKYEQNGFVYLVDEEGRLIAHPSQSYVFSRPNLVSRTLISRTLKNQHVSEKDFFYNNEKEIPVVAKATKIPGINWVVVFEQPTKEAFGFLNFIRNIFIVTLVGSSILLLLIAILLSENLSKSIRKLQESAKLIEKGSMDTNIILRTGDEIEALSVSFSSMVKQLMQREISLKKEKQESDTLLQSLTEAVIGLDENNNIIVFNNAAEHITGLKRDIAHGRNIDDILQLYEDEHIIPFSSYSNPSEASVSKYKEKGLKLSTTSNQKVIVSITVSAVLLRETKTGYIVTLHDISKERELEEMKLDFVSMAAHELRTPLTAIRGYASLLQMQNWKDMDEPGKELINRLLISSENLGNLIDNLLSVSRIERSAFSVDLKPVDLTDTIKNVVEGVKQQASTKKQTFRLTMHEELPVVLADAFRIGQVLTNIIANAVNYTQEGGIIDVKADKKDGYLQLSVSDNGQGIPREALPKLFTKFFRVSGKLEQGSKGTGLGLFISKSIVEMHKGAITVESELGRGSKFTVNIPVAKPTDILAFQQNMAQGSLTAKNGQGIIIKTKEITA